MAQKQFLHELLKEEQEPFRLKNYIADRRSRLKKTSPPPPASSSQLGKRKPNPSSTNILCKHACFLSFQTSPDVRKSPFFDFPSPPAKSPCKSPNGAVFLHIPSKTAALLVEAAIRVQKQQQQQRPKAHPSKNVGLGLLGSFLKRLKDRSSKAATKTITRENENDVVEGTRMSCSCSSNRRRPSNSSANWTTTDTNDNFFDFEASTSSCASEFSDARFCTSPFRFNLLQSPPPSARRTPEFRSPAASPSRRVNQEMENYISTNSDNVQEEEEEEEDKEQCSPVSVLDPPFEDDSGRLSRDADDDDDDYDLECSYENVQRAKHQLLYRLRRFEKLAELDTDELERDSMEGSDEDRSDVMSADMKKLVSDLITEEKNECDNEVAMGRVCHKLDSWGEVESNTIDMMVGFDFKGEFDGWTRFNEQREEISAEIEVAVFGLLVEELSRELF